MNRIYVPRETRDSLIRITWYRRDHYMSPTDRGLDLRCAFAVSVSDDDDESNLYTA